MTGVLKAKVDGEWVPTSPGTGPAGPAGPPGAASTVPGPEGPAGADGAPGDPGPQPRGAWSPVVTYQPDDVVTREGSAWIATVESTGVDPAGDASHTVIGSLTSPSGLALGSPTAVAQTFTVDRPMTALAINALAAFTGPPYDGLVGIASAINVPAVGVQWIGKGDPDATGYTLLDAPVALSVGVEYWFVMKLSQANVYIDQGADLIGSHVAWGNDFWYGSGEPSTDFGGTYGLPFVLYGTTGDDAWQLFVARGEPGPAGPPGPGPTEERWGNLSVTTDASGNALVTFSKPFPTGHVPAVMAAQGFPNVHVTVWGSTENYVQLHYQRHDGSNVVSTAITTQYRAWWPTASPT